MNALTQLEAPALSEQSARELNNIIERDAKAAADVRSRAAASILAGMKNRTPRTSDGAGKNCCNKYVTGGMAFSRIVLDASVAVEWFLPGKAGGSMYAAEVLRAIESRDLLPMVPDFGTTRLGVESGVAPGSRAYFTAKDVAMAEAADYGLIMWDARSTGTLSNVIELLRRKKKSAVFVNKNKEFMTVGDAAQAARAEALLDGNEVGAGGDEALLRPTAMPRPTEVMP